MGFDVIFVLVLVVLLVLGAVAGAFYLSSSKRRGGEQIDRSEGLSGSPEQRAKSDPHEFYMRTSLENDEDMKIHLYSINEYEDEFGGSFQSQGAGRFVAALKSYRPVGDEWYVLPPKRAAGILDLSPREYEVDGDHGALLLHKLPRGLPIEARDLL